MVEANSFAHHTPTLFTPEVSMLASYLLSLREGIEAALIIGIVLGALRQMRRTDLAPAVWLGALSAAALSLLGAILLTAFGLELEGAAEPIFEGITMILAAALLTWMIFWMSRTARTLKSNIEADVQRAAFGTGKRALFFVAFIAILREGIELALFLTASVFATDWLQTTLGAILGLGTAILLGWSIFAAILRLDLRRFFQVTGFLLILFAAGLVAHGIHEFNEVGWIPAVIEHVWDVNAILDENSTFGLLLKALFGYNGNPSLTEMLAYVAYFAAVFLGLRLANKPKPVTANQQA
jgi:high-affinity iron transporter